ncbi:MAG: hypothetical protein ACRCVT_14310 [Leadbetterella sp.]
MLENEIVNNDELLLTIKRKVKKFKAGSELADQVRKIVNAEITETEDEESKTFELFISVTDGSKLTKADAG